MSEDHHHEGRRDIKNVDAMNAEDNDKQMNDDNNGEENQHHANDQQAIIHHQEGSSTASLKDETPQPPSAAVDMTGSIKESPISSMSKTQNNCETNTMSIIRRCSANKLNDDEDESLKKRSRYYSSSEDEWGSSSLSIHLDANSSKELTVQQIHDQRVKLAAMNPPTSTGATQQVPSDNDGDDDNDEEVPSKTHLKKSSGSASVPGAYAVNPSGRNALLEDSSFFDNNEYSSSMTLHTNEHQASSMIMHNNTETDASPVMQLEAVPVDESLEQAKMKEMEEQMNLEISRRQSLERQIQEEKRRKSNTMSHNQKSCTKERIPIVMALLIILSGIAVGLYFLLAPKNESSSSNSNTTFFLYPPPTAEECETLLRDGKVPNQDKYPTLTMGLKLDVWYNSTVLDSIDAVLTEISERYDSNLPAMVGCNYDNNDGNGDFGQQQFLNGTFTENRYLVANAKLVNVTRSSASSDCDDDYSTDSDPLAITAAPCIRVNVAFLWWLKAETSHTDMIAFVHSNFGPTFFLNSLVEEGGIIYQAKVVSVGLPEDEDEPINNKDHHYLQYPPPTAEECEAILSGNAVPNQDQYSTVVIDTTNDISVSASSVSLLEDSMDAVMLEVRKILESSMVPIVTGCNSIGREIYNSNPTEIEYIFPNIQVMDVTRSSSECHTGAPQPCVQVQARFFIWLKRDLEAFDVILFMQNNFLQSFMETISDSDIIQQFTMVSAGPSPIQFEFPPPTEKECQAMSNGDPVPGQDRYFTQLADSVIDVSTHEPWEDNLDTVLLKVRNVYQTLIIPTLAGCMDNVDETWSNSTKTPDRYVWVNSLVLNVTHFPGECNAAEPRPCLKVKVRSQMWLQKELNFFALISLMDKNFGPALMAKIGNREDKSAIIKQAEPVMMSPPLDDPPPNDEEQNGG